MKVLKNTNNFRQIVLAVFVLWVIMLWGCSKAPEQAETPPAPADTVKQDTLVKPPVPEYQKPEGDIKSKDEVIPDKKQKKPEKQQGEISI